jgi:hypothetical protein
MECAGRDDDSITIMNHVFFRAIENKFGFTLFNTEKLVHRMMDFVADLLAWLQAHHNQLGKLPGEQHLAEKIILFGQFFDISYESGHLLCLLNVVLFAIRVDSKYSTWCEWIARLQVPGGVWKHVTYPGQDCI